MNNATKMILAGLLLFSVTGMPFTVHAQSVQGHERDIFAEQPEEEIKEEKELPPVTEYDAVKGGMLLENDELKLMLDKKKNQIAGMEETTRPTMNLEEIMIAYQNGDFTTALQGVVPLADAGHSGAQELLGIMYMMGQGVKQDHQKAFYWMKKAANEGRPLAEHYLGVMYYTGEGVESRDNVMALVWLNMAVLHYRDGPQKDRAVQDRENILVRLTRRQRDRARDLTRSALEERGEAHLMEFVD